MTLLPLSHLITPRLHDIISTSVVSLKWNVDAPVQAGLVSGRGGRRRRMSESEVHACLANIAVIDKWQLISGAPKQKG